MPRQGFPPSIGTAGINFWKGAPRSMSLEQCDQLARELRAKRDVNPPTLADTRANFAAYAARFPLDPDIACHTAELSGVPVEWLTPPDSSTGQCLLYLHGGGYIVGSPATHRALAGRLARAAGVRAVVPDYRLAPENPHPAPLEDALAVYEHILASGFAPESVVIGGDSAGGGLALATMINARDRGLPLPAAAICMSPWVDLEATGESVARCADSDPVVAPNHIRSFARMFLGGGDPRDPLAAPLHADLRGLPPLLIQVGDNETLLDDSRRLAAKADTAGVHVNLRVWPHMFHVWQLFASELDEGGAAIREAGDFVRCALSEAEGSAAGL